MSQGGYLHVSELDHTGAGTATWMPGPALNILLSAEPSLHSLTNFGGDFSNLTS